MGYFYLHNKTKYSCAVQVTVIYTVGRANTEKHPKACEAASVTETVHQQRELLKAKQQSNSILIVIFIPRLNIS